MDIQIQRDEIVVSSKCFCKWYYNSLYNLLNIQQTLSFRAAYICNVYCFYVKENQLKSSAMSDRISRSSKNRWVVTFCYWAILKAINNMIIVTSCIPQYTYIPKHALRWRHNERDGVTNHQPHDCLLKRLFRRRSKKTSKLCMTGLCAGNSPVTGEFPAQRTSNAENVSIWWRHHGCTLSRFIS